MEAVLIPIVREAGAKPRITLCVSSQVRLLFRDARGGSLCFQTGHRHDKQWLAASQVGCAMNCQFCLTGRMGLMANLSAAQIIEQARPLTPPVKNDCAVEQHPLPLISAQ